jgi:uncharacterized protein YecE (DUF72 family)
VEFRIGTSGWHYKHWRGDFYPQELEPREWFGWYARRFDTVEINNSFYRQPSAHAWRLWRDAAPDGFVFAVKASRFITHIKRLKEPEDSLKRALDGARRLGAHLGPLLYQLPPTFRRDVENVGRLVTFVQALSPDVCHVIEFRHESWFVEETFDLLDRHGVGFCAFDMPGIECPQRATGPVAYMRFHGAGARYGGSYTDEMLRGWAGRLREMSAGRERCFVYFNNDVGGHAPRNALTLREIVD